MAADGAAAAINSPTGRGDPARADDATDPRSKTQLDTVVYRYLISKGYAAAAAALQQEGQTVSLAELEAQYIDEPARHGFEVALPNWILLDQGTDAVARGVGAAAGTAATTGGDTDGSASSDAAGKAKHVAYEAAYRALRRFVDEGLDRLRPELDAVLFPVFVHLFLDLVARGLGAQAAHLFQAFNGDHVQAHGPVVEALAAVREPSHLRESETAKRFLENKYDVRLSRCAFELLLDFLQGAGLTVVLRVLHMRVGLQVLGDSAQGEPDVGLTGVSASGAAAMNATPCQLGLPVLDSRILDEMERRVKARVGDESRDAVLQAVTAAKKAAAAAAARPADDVAAPAAVALPTLRLADTPVYLAAAEDAAHRLPLGRDALPSACMFTFHNTYGSATCVRTSQDLSLTAMGFSDSMIQVWSSNGGKLHPLTRAVDPVAGAPAPLGAFRQKKGTQCVRLVGHAGPVYGLSFSHDSRYMLSCSEDRTARLWSTETMSSLVCYRGHNFGVWDVEFGPMGYLFATASYDRTARLWSCEEVQPLRIFAGHLDDVHCVRFHPNSGYVVTGSGDTTARMWDVATGRSVRLFKRHRGGVYRVAVAPNGRYLATAGEDLRICLWDLADGRCVKAFEGHSAAINSLAFSADSAVLASGGMDDSVRIWDVQTAAVDAVEPPPGLLATFLTKRTPVLDVAFTRRNLLLATGVVS